MNFGNLYSTLTSCVALMLLSVSTVAADGFWEGFALVSSREGEGLWEHPSQTTAKGWPPLHAQREMGGVRLQSADDAHLVLVLSNRLALALGQSTQVHCEQFMQAPISGTDRFTLEPSTSRLVLRLDAGRIGVATGELRADSEVRILGPNGALMLRSGVFVITQHARTLQVKIFEGNARFESTQTEVPEFIPARTVFEVSPQGKLTRERLADIEHADADAWQLSEAARFARTRVHAFPVTTSASKPLELKRALPASTAGKIPVHPLRPQAKD